MKRADLVRHLESHSCEVLREGGRHPVHANRASGKATAVPGRREINGYLTRKICRDLEIVDL